MWRPIFDVAVNQDQQDQPDDTVHGLPAVKAKRSTAR
jgi:hypothetical protein